MFNSKKRKEARMKSEGAIVSDQKYNIIIGAMLLYGFVMNAIMVLLTGQFFMEMNPIVFLIGYFVSALIGSIMVNVSKNPIVSFIGYNLIVVPIGALLSICLPGYSIGLILSAIIVTAIIAAIMMLLGSMFPQFFSKIGLTLFIALLVGIIAEFVAMLLGYGGDIFNWIFVIIFSLYMGYDWYRAQAYPKTVDNAIDSAVDLYLDIINIFVRLLEIFGKKD